MAAGANAILRHYVATLVAGSTWETVFAGTAAGRALVVSKIIVVNASSSAQAFNLRTGASKSFANAVPLNTGEVYTETGLILLTGEPIEHFSTVAAGIVTHVFGEEVDVS